MEQIVKAIESVSESTEDRTGFSEEFISEELVKLDRVIDSRIENLNVFSYGDNTIVLREPNSPQVALVNIEEEEVDIKNWDEVSDDLEVIQSIGTPRDPMHD